MRVLKLSVTLVPFVIVLHVMVAEAQSPLQQGAPSGLLPGQSVDSPPPPLTGGTSRVAGVDIPLGGTNEPSIVVNPTNPQNIIASAAFSYRVSNNGGNTFGAPISNVVPAGYFQSGDTSLAFDSQGRLFYSYLGFFSASGGLDCIVSEINPTTGALVAGPFVASTSGPAGGSNDKPWLAVDRFVGSPFQNRLYLVWSEFPAAAAERVLFAFSADRGVTWSSPLQLSTGSEGFVWPPHVAVAPNGDVYVSYHAHFSSGSAGSVAVLRSTDGGVTFPQKTSAFTAGKADVTFNVQDSGGTIPNTAFWLQGSAQAWVLPDPLTPGNVYVVANDDPDNLHGSGDDADVFIARSTDNGLTWAAPLRVDHGPGGTFQVMPTAAIDDNSGCIVVMWYDNRLGGSNGAGNDLLNVFYTVSGDGGLTFGPDVQINDVAFDPDLGAPQRFPGPPPTLRIGEYNGVAFVGSNVSAVWAGNTGSGQQMIFDTAFIGACGDLSSPSPDPMQWEPGGEPAATSATEITMTAALATDTQNSVEYCLMGLSGPGVGSLCWQAARTFTDTGLLANEVYAYEARARDTALPPNETLPSPTLSAATFIESPTTFFFGTVTDTSIGLTAFNPTGAFSNLAIGSSGLFFEMTPPGGVNANVWVQSQFVDVTGLTPGTMYTVRVKARNQLGVETPFTFAQSTTTTGAAGCTLLGDVNQDGVVDGKDIDGYLRAKLGQPPAVGEDPLCADFGNGGDLTLDTAAFVSALLAS